MLARVVDCCSYYTTGVRVRLYRACIGACTGRLAPGLACRFFVWYFLGGWKSSIRLGSRTYWRTAGALSREPADRSIGCQLVDKLESSVGRRPSRKWCSSGWCVSGRAAEARVGCAWEGRDVAIGGDGVRIARKGMVRERGVCGWSVAEAGEGGHRAWRGDAHRTALREQGCAGHAAGGCQGGAAAPEGRSGLGELCVGRVWCRGTVLRTGGGRWGEGEARRPEGSAPPCAFAWSGASFLPLPGTWLSCNRRCGAAAVKGSRANSQSLQHDCFQNYERTDPATENGELQALSCITYKDSGQCGSFPRKVPFLGKSERTCCTGG